MSEYSVALGSTLAGKYKILRVLGAGGMGAVYLAENLDIGRQVAIKVLHSKIGEDAATRQRFRLEARTSAVINHPGIVDVLDMGETEAGEAFIVMERLEGQTLGARLKQRGKLSLDEATSIIGEALDAIGAAHAKGIVHRDLKPDNLFLVWTPRWCVKILDFGISRFVNTEDVRLTASNTLMGSVLYMPPEQARDARMAGPTADLYALGATLYHALGGKPPFMGESYTEVLSRVLGDPPMPLEQLRSDLPDGLAKLVMQLLQKDPAARPQSAADVRARLIELVPAAKPPEPPTVALEDTAKPEAALAATADVPPPATGLGATAEASAPGGIALGATAEASAPGFFLPELKIPKGVATSSIVGEVERLEAAQRKRRTVPMVVLGSVAVAGAIGFAVFRSRDSSSTATQDALIPQAADAGIPDVAVTDTTPLPDLIPDAGARQDAGPKRPRPDAPTPVIRADAAVPKPDAKAGNGSAYGTGLQGLPNKPAE